MGHGTGIYFINYKKKQQRNLQPNILAAVTAGLRYSNSHSRVRLQLGPTLYTECMDYYTMLCTNPTGNISGLSQNSVGVQCPKDESFDPLMQ